MEPKSEKVLQLTSINHSCSNGTSNAQNGAQSSGKISNGGGSCYEDNNEADTNTNNNSTGSASPASNSLSPSNSSSSSSSSSSLSSESSSDSSSSNSGSTGTSSNITAFLSKLWRLVNDQSSNDLITWSQSGCSFVILNQIQFAKDLLPLYFKHSNMASFIRQLNMYGFRKIPLVGSGGNNDQRVDLAQFYHVNFARGEEHRLSNIKRKNATSKSDNLIVNGNFCDQVRSILSDVRSIRDGNSSSETILGAIQLDNKTLWRDIAILRTQGHKQRRVMEKLIQFLLSLIHKRANIGGKKRKVRLMISSPSCDGSDHADRVKSDRSSSFCGESGSSGSSGEGGSSTGSSAGVSPSLINRRLISPQSADYLARRALNSTAGSTMSFNQSQFVQTLDQIHLEGREMMGSQQQQQQLDQQYSMNGHLHAFDSHYQHQQPSHLMRLSANGNINLASSSDRANERSEQDANGYQRQQQQQQLQLQFGDGAGSAADQRAISCHHVNQWAASSIYNTMAADNPPGNSGLGMSMFNELRAAPNSIDGRNLSGSVANANANDNNHNINNNNNNNNNNNSNNNHNINDANNSSNNNNNHHHHQQVQQQLHQCFYN